MSIIYWSIEYGATFIEWFMCTLFCGTFIKEADLKKNLYIRLFSSVILSIIVILINSVTLFSSITSIITFSLAAMSQLILYNKNKLKASMLACFFCLAYFLIDIITVNSISYILKIPSNSILEKQSVYRVIAIICSKFILIIFTVALNKLYSKNNNIDKKHILYLLVFTIIMAVLNLGLIFIDIKKQVIPSYVSVLFSVIAFVLIMVIFLGTIKLTEYYENRQQLNIVKLRNEMLEHSMNETENTFMLWKNSLHNYKHNILNIMALANNGNLQGIKDYIEKENELLSKTLFYYKTGNDTVDTILNVKQKYAEEKGITFIINADIPENCHISPFDFSSILGNLIDNAIEASEKENEPYIEVKIKRTENFLVIVVLNKCTKPEITLKTDKANKEMHGIGISSVKYTVKQYNGEFTIKSADNIFSANIMIPLRT